MGTSGAASWYSIWVWPFYPLLDDWLVCLVWNKGQQSMQTIGCLAHMPMHLRVPLLSSTGPCATTMRKINFHFLLFQMPLITLTLNYLVMALLYAVRKVQSESDLYKAFPVKSNIAGHNLLKTEIGITFGPVAVSILHLASTLCPVLLPSESSGTICTLVLACDVGLWCYCGVSGLIGDLVGGKVVTQMNVD